MILSEEDILIINSMLIDLKSHWKRCTDLKTGPKEQQIQRIEKRIDLLLKLKKELIPNSDHKGWVLHGK